MNPFNQGRIETTRANEISTKIVSQNGIKGSVDISISVTYIAQNEKISQSEKLNPTKVGNVNVIVESN